MKFEKGQSILDDYILPYSALANEDNSEEVRLKALENIKGRLSQPMVGWLRENMLYELTPYLYNQNKTINENVRSFLKSEFKNDEQLDVFIDKSKNAGYLEEFQETADTIAGWGESDVQSNALHVATLNLALKRAGTLQNRRKALADIKRYIKQPTSKADRINLLTETSGYIIDDSRQFAKETKETLTQLIKTPLQWSVFLSYATVFAKAKLNKTQAEDYFGKIENIIKSQKEEIGSDSVPLKWNIFNKNGLTLTQNSVKIDRAKIKPLSYAS